MVAQFPTDTAQSLPSNRGFNTATPAHLNEWVAGSAVSEEIAQLNIESLKVKEINERVKPKTRIKTPGWWCRGVNWRTGEPMGNRYGQAKPDHPHDLGNGKSAKYLTASGMEPDAIFLAMSDKDYWLKVWGDKSITRYWTEGVKKAGAGLSASLPTIAVTGVWNWGKDGELAQLVKEWAVPGTKHVLCFDSDYATKPSCKAAVSKLAKLLEQEGCQVKIATWDTQWKGMDDFIVDNGGDAFKEVVANALTIAKWEKQFASTDNAPSTRKKPPASRLGREIAEDYRKLLAFNNETRCWMRYNADLDGMWSAETDEYMESIVYHILKGKGIEFDSHNYVTGIVRTMRDELIVRKWEEPSPKDLLPFRNGVLEVATGQLLPHSPHYRFTWQLPRQHRSDASDWSGIEAFLNHLTAGNPGLKNILLCFCNAVLTGRSDLQKFLHLIGLGGTGKGTFARLLVDLIGKENVFSTTMEDLCGNRFESSGAYRKRLTIFWDEDKQTGKLGKFLSLTGGDLIRAEEKGKKKFDFPYDGMVMVLSNAPVFMGSAASRMARRVIPVPCNNTVATILRRDLNAEFQDQLDAFTNYVLSIPYDKVTRVLKGLEKNPICTLEFWENRTRVDSIAAWLNDWVIHDPNAVTQVGGDRTEGDNRAPVTLYGSYALYCKQAGMTPKASKNFSPDLIELCHTVLGWPTERQVTKTGKFIKGLRLRTDADFEISTYDYYLMQQLGDGSKDGLGDGSESLCGKDLSKGDGLSSLFPQGSENNNPVSECLNQKGIGLDPSPPPKPLPDNPSDPSPASVTSPVTSKPMRVKSDGQEVVIPVEYPDINGFKGVSKEPKKIKSRLLAVKSRSEYDEIKRGYGLRALWVIYRMLTESERQHLTRMITTPEQGRQMSFDEVHTPEPAATHQFIVGDRVVVVGEPELGEGEISREDSDWGFLVEFATQVSWHQAQKLQRLL
jgi:putative DNA primase/helicase